jgi:hypothetical protein
MKAPILAGHHLVHEVFAGDLARHKISFRDPAKYFGPTLEEDFRRAGYSIAVYGRTGDRNDQTGQVNYMGHLIHSIKDEPNGIRTRSRFWLEDIPGVSPEARRVMVSEKLPMALLQHATEEMPILATIGLHEKYARKDILESPIYTTQFSLNWKSLRMSHIRFHSRKPQALPEANRGQ